MPLMQLALDRAGSAGLVAVIALGFFRSRKHVTTEERKPDAFGARMRRNQGVDKTISSGSGVSSRSSLLHGENENWWLHLPPLCIYFRHALLVPDSLMCHC
jgi:hypothetical protein